MENEEIWIPPASFVSSFCRICVATTDVDCNIYDDTGEEHGRSISLHTMMKSLVPTIFNVEQATSDQNLGWPSKICQECKELVTVAYRLYELCINSTERLQKLLSEERYVILAEDDTLRVEQDYLSDLVQMEFVDSDGSPGKSASYKASRKQPPKTYGPASSKKRATKTSQDASSMVVVYSDERETLQQNSAESAADLEKPENTQDVALESKESSTVEEHSKSTNRDSKPFQSKRSGPRRKKECTTTVSMKTQDSIKSDFGELVTEPQSIIDLYRCQLCVGPTYTSPTELNVHLKAKHADQIRSCDQCPKVFMNDSAFQHHQYCHATKRSHFCTFCDKGFQTVDLLKSHIRMHTHRADYLCSLCGKEFNNKSNLRQHVRRHTGDKPWACNQCPGRFTTKGGLTSHQHTHTNVKAFSCDTCGSQFNKHYSLIKHQLIHTGTRPYSCEVCEMRFTSSYHVKRHMRTHTGEKPFKCTYCERSFAQSNDMVKHMRMHVGDNPYQCDRCDASYRLLSDLRNHYKEHYQSGEKAPGASSAEEENGFRFTSTDILRIRYRKEMAQGHVEIYEESSIDAPRVMAKSTEVPSVP